MTKARKSFNPASFLFLVLIIFLVSCESKKDPVKKEPVKQPELVSEKAPAPRPDSPELDVLAEFPPEMYGCSCYFARNQQEFKKEQYIYINDYAETSIISVNGKLNKLVLKYQSDSLAKEKFYVYANTDYELKVTKEKSRDVAEEVSKIEGQLILKEIKTGTTKRYFYTGECGC
ncbi:hypothetical protein I5M27_18030 [Adhaeribacter sp. BT258]|uniref:NlpE N-terminal domain-containing protein n=1 Tax=Adhaeribacter terrigena TaxID=2793070 RepID=A0ABS1C6B9_9BACT|nr:hypothetical protein [Adhaeribacter terrigena]MBK0404895.1 hypothetical protein [Adhaeribacter terrigena]